MSSKESKNDNNQKNKNQKKPIFENIQVQPKHTDSMLKMIRSEGFTMDLQMQYLFTKFNEPGIRDLLTNQLYQRSDSEIDFYLSQLCYMAVNRQAPLLEKFLIDKSSENMAQYLMIHWYLQAFSDAMKVRNKEKEDQIDNLERQVETSMVNGKTLQNFKADEEYKKRTPEDFEQYTVKLFMEKEHRSNYTYMLNKIIKSIINTSVRLKEIKLEDRNKKLRQQLIKTNRQLEKNRRDNEEKEYFQGIIFPFFHRPEDTTHSNFIVRVLEDEAFCFNTKMRVPYKMVVETIDIKDLKGYKRRNISYPGVQRSLSDLDDIADIDEQLPHNGDKNVSSSSQSSAPTSKNDKYSGLPQFAMGLHEEQQQQQWHDVARTTGSRNSEPTRLIPIDLIENFEPRSSVNDFHRVFSQESGMYSSCAPYQRKASQMRMLSSYRQYSPHSSQLDNRQRLAAGSVAHAAGSVAHAAGNAALKRALTKYLTDNPKIEAILAKQRSKRRTFGSVGTRSRSSSSSDDDRLFKGEHLARKKKAAVADGGKHQHSKAQSSNGSQTQHHQNAKNGNSGKCISEGSNGQNQQWQRIKIKLFKRRNSYRDLNIRQVVNFFTEIRQLYPKYEQRFDIIYKHLNYDLAEKAIASSATQQNENNTHNGVANSTAALSQNSSSPRTASSTPYEKTFPRVFGVWGEVWEDKCRILRDQSPYGHFPSYRIRCLIVKGNDDLRQEWIAMQVMIIFRSIFEEEKINLWLRPYDIIITSSNSGLIEFLPNTLSIDAIKKKTADFRDLLTFYKDTFGQQFEEAQKKFIESLAAYSLFCYLLQIKDRHNGNILIDNEGHIIHIDFGFMLSSSPGNNYGFEKAPFKLTVEYVDLMGGKKSDLFGYFKNLLLRGFIAVRKKLDPISTIIEIMHENSNLGCFTNFNLAEFKNRFQFTYTDSEFMKYVDELVDESYDNRRTRYYDSFQKSSNNISI